MKKMVLLFVLLALTFTVFPSMKSKLMHRYDESSQNIKCTTRDGDVFYGNVPIGVVCESVEAVAGAVTVINSQFLESDAQPLDALNSICDGRSHCSQMTSCEEAVAFLRNCPNMNVDGNNDGVPCEQQWCN